MSARSITLLVLLLALAGVSIAAAATSIRSDSDPVPSRTATQQQYSSIKDGLAQQRIELEFLLLHARLRDDAELAGELGELARTSAEQAEVLAAIDPPSSIAGLVQELHTAVAEQTAALRAVARRTRTDGPPAARAASAALLAQTARILQARQRLENSFVIGS